MRQWGRITLAGWRVEAYWYRLDRPALSHVHGDGKRWDGRRYTCTAERPSEQRCITGLMFDCRLNSGHVGRHVPFGPGMVHA